MHEDQQLTQEQTESLEKALSAPPAKVKTRELPSRKTACVRKCKLDEATQTCTGCNRTITEIANAGRVSR